MANATTMQIKMIVKYKRSTFAALIVSNSTPKAGNFDVRVLRFLVMSKIAIIAEYYE